MISSTTAAMALPKIPVPYAVRLDAPARMNRPGARNAFLHALERRGLGRARLTLPLSHAALAELPAGRGAGGGGAAARRGLRAAA